MGKRQTRAVLWNRVGREGKADGLGISSNTNPAPHPPPAPAPSPAVVNNQKLVLFCGSDNSFILKEIQFSYSKLYTISLFYLI